MSVVISCWGLFPGRWIVPAVVARNQCLGRSGFPGGWRVGKRGRVIYEHGIDHSPSRFDRVLAREEGAITRHGVTEQALVGRALAELVLAQIELTLVADKVLARTLDACREGYG